MQEIFTCDLAYIVSHEKRWIYLPHIQTGKGGGKKVGIYVSSHEKVEIYVNECTGGGDDIAFWVEVVAQAGACQYVPLTPDLGQGLFRSCLMDPPKPLRQYLSFQKPHAFAPSSCILVPLSLYYVWGK